MLKVLIIGDPPGSPGGIAQVMNLVNEWCSKNPTIIVTFRDPLGKSTSTHPNVSAFAKTLIGMVVNRPDLIHFNTASRGSTYRNIAISLVARVLGIPYIIHLHGGGYPGFLRSVRRGQLNLIRTYFTRSANVIALTPTWKQFVTVQLGVSDKKVCVISNGTADPSNITMGAQNKTKNPSFVYAGRLTAAKGVHELVEAFQQVPASAEISLVLIGNGRDGAVRTSLLDSPENITEMGWCSNSQTLEAMAKAWAVILPSHYENMPLTILEAMSVSTAVIATGVGGIPEIVRDDVDGLLVPAGDICLLAKSIEALCNFDLAVTYGRNGRARWLQNYTSSQMCESISGVWHDASK